jgi:hypothetical protein
VDQTLTVPPDRLGRQYRRLAHRTDHLGALHVLHATVEPEDDVLSDLDPDSADRTARQISHRASTRLSDRG